MTTETDTNTTTPAPSKRAFPKPKIGAKPADASADPATPPAAGENAEAEQVNPASKLTQIDWDAAMGHTSEGKSKGVIRSVAPTKSGNGITVGVAHEDGSYATLSFNMFRVEKVNGTPKIDPTTGKEVIFADVQAQKAYGEFCKFFGVSPSELTAAAIAYADKKTPERPPLCGVEAMWDFAYSGTFLNAKLDIEGTNALRAEEAAA